MNEQRQIKRSIRRLEKENQNINEGEANTLLSTRVTNDPAVAGKRKLRPDAIDVNFEPEKRPKMENDVPTVDRNKRMLKVGILGHLVRARDALKKEQDQQNTIKHMEKDKMISLKLEEREKEQISLIQKDAKEQLAKEQESLKKIDESLLEKQTQLMKHKLKSHYTHMQNFIATKTQPTIFWAPRNYNPQLESLRNTTQEFIAQKLKAIEATNYSRV
ncbi:Pinin-SDK-MemA protein [Babesia duncani]|uniref:Pinin-SDK-MemA protein n=1 Tax=Babesia duncani TaxID=323732 RepID=A0AAD9PNI0_9APIC|nr:Pinin-SDK-MemA protein [Babesia duncani]